MAGEHNETAQTRRLQLQQRSQGFCAAFLDLASNPPEKMLDQHFTGKEPQITEHGPSWATKRLPFIGQTFTGRAQCLDYFDQLARTLKFVPNEHTFPPEEGFIVDDEAVVGTRASGARGMVSVVGKAKFRAVQTGRTWEEQFIYRLSGFDEDGRIGHWEIWADPLSAWAAVGGEEVA